MKNKKYVIVLSVVGFVIFGFFWARPTVAEFALKKELASNCLQAIIPSTAEVDTVFDPENNRVKTSWSVDGVQMSLVLPFEPFYGFEGCSLDAKRVLKGVEENYTSYINDSCKDFKEIIAGAKPLPERNGEKANIKGAIDFVNKNCK